MLSGQNETQTWLYPLVTVLVQGLAYVPQSIMLRCEPGSAVAVSVTGDPTAKLASQGPVIDPVKSSPYGSPEYWTWQLMPAGLLVTVPLPQPSIQTFTVA